MRGAKLPKVCRNTCRSQVHTMDVGGCRHSGPFSDLFYNTAPNIQGTQKGTIILTTTHVAASIRGDPG